MGLDGRASLELEYLRTYVAVLSWVLEVRKRMQEDVGYGDDAAADEAAQGGDSLVMVDFLCRSTHIDVVTY